MLNDMKLPLDVNIENHVTREGRLGVALVRDDPEAELTKVGLIWFVRTFNFTCLFSFSCVLLGNGSY